jgi:hypothetical protein
MIYPIALHKGSGGFAWVFDELFEGIQQAFVPMKNGVLEFVPDVFFINSFVSFLSAVTAKIISNVSTTILASVFYLKFHECNNVEGYELRDLISAFTFLRL